MPLFFYKTAQNPIHTQVFAQAVLNVPKYYHIYQAYLRTIKPRWGGTKEEMMQFLGQFASNKNDKTLKPYLIIQAHLDAADYHGRMLDSLKDEPLDLFMARLLFGTKSARDYFADPAIWDQVTEITHHLLEENPNRLNVMNSYAYIAALTGKQDIAFDYYMKILEIDPGYDPYVLIKIAKMLQNKKQYEQALDYFDLALELWPEFRRALSAKGFLLTEMNKWQDSVKIYEKLVRNFPERNYEANLCASYTRTKQYEQAHKACDLAIQKDPLDPWPHHLKGWTYRWQGQEAIGGQYIAKAKELGWKGYAE